MNGNLFYGCGTALGTPFNESGVEPLTVSDTYTFDLPAFGIRTLMLR